MVWNTSSWIPDKPGDPFTYGGNTQGINALWRSGAPGTVFGSVLFMDNLLTGWARPFIVNEGRYDKLLVARPIMPMGRDIGYLPGSVEEKLNPWMQPIFDNLTYLLSTRGSHIQNAESHSSEQRIQKLMADGKLVLEPPTYIRGRSIPT